MCFLGLIIYCFFQPFLYWLPLSHDFLDTPPKREEYTSTPLNLAFGHVACLGKETEMNEVSKFLELGFKGFPPLPLSSLQVPEGDE